MKITQHTTTNLITKDSGGCLWLFGLFFVVVAGTFVIGLMGAFNNLNELNQLEQTAVWIVSLAGVAAGFWIIYSNPVIRADFDKREGVVNIRRKSLLRNETENYLLSDIKDVIIKELKDDEGYAIFSAEIILADNSPIALTKNGFVTKKNCRRL